jgi:hypothetical protein
MGSGKKFRIMWESYPVYSIGASMAFRSEHEVSIHLNFVKLLIYIGIGKGYEEFEKEKNT